MAKYVLRGSSRSGKRLPGSTGSSTSIAVYDDADLKRRLTAAKDNPDLEVTVEELDEDGLRRR